jgi:hypothetical protein
MEKFRQLHVRANWRIIQRAHPRIQINFAEHAIGVN